MSDLCSLPMLLLLLTLSFHGDTSSRTQPRSLIPVCSLFASWAFFTPPIHVICSIEDFIEIFVKYCSHRTKWNAQSMCVAMHIRPKFITNSLVGVGKMPADFNEQLSNDDGIIILMPKKSAAPWYSVRTFDAMNFLTWIARIEGIAHLLIFIAENFDKFA